MVRRIVVLVAAIALLAGVVSVVKGLVADETSTAAGTGAGATTVPIDPGASTTSSLDPSAGSVDPAATVPPTAAADTSTTATATAPSDTNTLPTAADPARVLLVGDSEAGGLSPFLAAALKAAGLTNLTTDYKVSSGFVRNV